MRVAVLGPMPLCLWRGCYAYPGQLVSLVTCAQITDRVAYTLPPGVSHLPSISFAALYPVLSRGTMALWCCFSLFNSSYCQLCVRAVLTADPLHQYYPGMSSFGVVHDCRRAFSPSAYRLLGSFSLMTWN